MIINLKNEKGVTLVEILATLLITAIISILAMGILQKTLANYDYISEDTELRNEADFMMSSLVKDLYTTKEKYITDYLPEGTSKKYYLLISPDANTASSYITGFKDKNLYIHGKVYDISNNRIEISNKSSISTTNEGVYEITLVLTIPKKNKEVTFKNTVKTITNIKGE